MLNSQHPKLTQLSLPSDGDPASVSPTSEYMDVVDFETHDPPRSFRIIRKEKPNIKSDQVLIRIAATTVTDFDFLRRNHMKAYPGIDTLLGMECSGEIEAVGSDVTAHRKGDKVCALLKGGGYAEYVAVSACQVIPIPQGMPLDHAAALPCASSLVWHAFSRAGKLSKNSSVLVHNGVGEHSTLAIQLAKKIYGCTVFTTGSGALNGEIEYCEDIGADYFIKTDEHFIESILNKTGQRGVDFIFDAFGSRVNNNLKILARGGTLAIVSGHHKIDNVDLDFGLMQRMQIKLAGMYFYLLPIEETRKILEEIVQHLWPLFENGRLAPRIYGRNFYFEDVADAFQETKNFYNLGEKLLLVPTQPTSSASAVGIFLQNLISWALP